MLFFLAKHIRGATYFFCLIPMRSSQALLPLRCRDPNLWRCFPNTAGSGSGSGFGSVPFLPCPCHPLLCHSLLWAWHSAHGDRAVLGGTAKHPFAAGCTPLNSVSPLMNLQRVLAKNTNQAPLSKLDSRRGNSLIDYIKKWESFLKEGKIKPAEAEGSCSLQLLMRTHIAEELKAEMRNLPLLVPVPLLERRRHGGQDISG